MSLSLFSFFVIQSSTSAPSSLSSSFSSSSSSSSVSSLPDWHSWNIGIEQTRNERMQRRSKVKRQHHEIVCCELEEDFIDFATFPSHFTFLSFSFLRFAFVLSDWHSWIGIEQPMNERVQRRSKVERQNQEPLCCESEYDSNDFARFSCQFPLFSFALLSAIFFSFVDSSLALVLPLAPMMIYLFSASLPVFLQCFLLLFPSLWLFCVL